jgi:hypothetical protein
MQVVRHLLKDHKLEQDVVGNLLEKELREDYQVGDRLRECCEVGMPADSIANEVASYLSK